MLVNPSDRERESPLTKRGLDSGIRAVIEHAKQPGHSLPPMGAPVWLQRGYTAFVAPRAKQEIEIKLRIADISVVRWRLITLGARRLSRVHEDNVLYDTPRQTLRRRGQLLRLRVERRLGPGAGPGRESRQRRGTQKLRGVLTYKGPGASQPGRHRTARVQAASRYKIRQEQEILVQDPDALRRLLTALGLRPVFRYEKFRTTYRVPGIAGVLVELDETPIGVFLELEGVPQAIDRASHRLGYGPKDYLVSSYGAIYLAECRRRGIRPSNMLFPAQKVR
jgi:adenylate cyclase class 2